MCVLIVITKYEFEVRTFSNPDAANEHLKTWRNFKFAAFLFGRDGKLISSNVEIDLD